MSRDNVTIPLEVGLRLLHLARQEFEAALVNMSDEEIALFRGCAGGLIRPEAERYLANFIKYVAAREEPKIV